MTNSVGGRDRGTEVRDQYFHEALRQIGMSVEQYDIETFSNPILAVVLTEQIRLFREAHRRRDPIEPKLSEWLAERPENLEEFLKDPEKVIREALPHLKQEDVSSLLDQAKLLDKQIRDRLEEESKKFAVDVSLPQQPAVPSAGIAKAPDTAPAEVAEVALTVRLDTLNKVLAEAIGPKIQLAQISRSMPLRIFGNVFDAAVDVAVSVPRIEPVPNDGGRFAVVIPIKRGTLKAPGIELDFSGAEVVATIPVGAVQVELVWGDNVTIQPVVRLNQSGLKVPVTLRNVPDKAKVISEILKIASELVEKMTAAVFVPDIRLTPYTPFEPKDGAPDKEKKQAEDDRQAFLNLVRVAPAVLPTLVRLGFVGSGRDPNSAKVVLRVLMTGRYATDLSGSDARLLANDAAVLTVGGKALVDGIMRPLLSASLGTFVKGYNEGNDLNLSYAPFRIELKRGRELDSDKLARLFLDGSKAYLFRRFVKASIDRLSLSVTGNQVMMSAALSCSVEYGLQLCAVGIDLNAAYELKFVEEKNELYVCFDKKEWKCSIRNDTSLAKSALLLWVPVLREVYVLVQALLFGGSAVANSFLDLSTYIPGKTRLSSSVKKAVKVGGVTVDENWHLTATPL